ncbi:MAG: hypothetical protein KC613_22605 [Myxococcales bacterium]|nr:hypothetical protein [Myxococcales bacterium]
MSFEEQWKEFDQRLKHHYSNLRISTARGASNGPLVLENGFRLGLFNIDHPPERISKMLQDGATLVLGGAVVLPPGHILNLALSFQDEALRRLGERLESIRQEPVPSGKKAGQTKGRANKVRVCLHHSGVFLHQDTDGVRIIPDTMGPAVWPSGAVYSDVAHPGELPPISYTWIGYISTLLELMPNGPALVNLDCAAPKE